MKKFKAFTNLTEINDKLKSSPEFRKAMDDYRKASQEMNSFNPEKMDTAGFKTYSKLRDALDKAYFKLEQLERKLLP
jgi:hypothetical protein